MIIKGLDFIKKLIAEAGDDRSHAITDQKILQRYIDDEDFPFIVSFPRTGSHWLRMIMELYFEKPALVRAFYFKEATDFTCFHTHDMDLKLQRGNVIYLYRNSVETIYSQLRYYKENPDDQERRRHWTDLYARHLAKWLVNENFTRKKTVLTYEGMKSDMAGEFAKVCSHFGAELDAGRLENVLARVSKEELKKKTRHDSQVVNLTSEYVNERENFRNKYSDLIFEEIYRVDKKLEDILRNSF